MFRIQIKEPPKFAVKAEQMIFPSGDRYEIGFGEGMRAGVQSEYDRFWDTYQVNGERTAYQFAFTGTGWTEAIFKPKYLASVSNATSMFEFFFRDAYSTANPFDFSDLNRMFDFSKCTNFTAAFRNAQIKNLFVDCSSASSLPNTFASGNGGMLENLTLKVTDKTTSFSGTFGYQSKTKEIRFTDDSEIVADITFGACTSLSKASIESIINTLSPPEKVRDKTLTLSLSAVNKAFETFDGAKDGSTSDEWRTLVAGKTNWTISLI